MQLHIKEVLASKKMTQAELAERLGMHPVNLNRLINGVIDVNMGRIEEIAKILDVPPEQLIVGPSAVRNVTVRGFVQAGHWAETWEWHDEDRYSVPVPVDDSLQPFTLYGAEARGPSMNRRYPDGTVLVFTDMIETGEQVQLGKRYVVERERADGLREATVKKLWRDDAGRIWLVPESDDPRFQESIPIEGGEDDTIRIVGRVRYAVSRE
jgi:transcriptional regulator with XRE-family HTH domain